MDIIQSQMLRCLFAVALLDTNAVGTTAARELSHKTVQVSIAQHHIVQSHIEKNLSAPAYLGIIVERHIAAGCPTRAGHLFAQLIREQSDRIPGLWG
jgi:hypothetical protein